MSVDTNGCIITKVKDVFKVTQVICTWWSELHKNESFRPLQKVEGRAGVVVEVSGYHDALHARFQYKEEERGLFAHFDCDCDLANHNEIKGESCVWLRLGCWGSSVEIMESLLREFRKQEWVERCYIDENDCDDEGYKEI